jgi:hypothetical protein
MIVLLGCGALGSQLAMHIAVPEHRFLLVDDDMVGAENVATSAFYRHDVNNVKVYVLAMMMIRKAGCQVEATKVTFDIGRSRLVEGAALIIDTFDNAAARQAARQAAQQFGVPLLHVGVNEHRVGGVFWTEAFAMPDHRYERGQNPVCTHHLGRPILRRTAVVAAEIVELFLTTGQRRNEVVKVPTPRF